VSGQAAVGKPAARGNRPYRVWHIAYGVGLIAGWFGMVKLYALSHKPPYPSFLPYSDDSDDFLIADEVNKCTPGIRRTDSLGR